MVVDLPIPIDPVSPMTNAIEGQILTFAGRDEEAFAVVPVSPDEVRDLDFVNDVSEVLKDFCQRLENGCTTNNDRR